VQPVAEAETAVKRPRAAGYVTGAALLLSGLALNPLGLAHFLQQNSPYIQGILALQVALIISGGWLVWHLPPRPLVPTALASVALSIAPSCILATLRHSTRRRNRKIQRRESASRQSRAPLASPGPGRWPPGPGAGNLHARRRSSHASRGEKPLSVRQLHLGARTPPVFRPDRPSPRPNARSPLPRGSP
jgi:hypothetical protein